MPIIVNLDVVMAQRKCRLNDLSENTGISIQNLSLLKNGKVRAIRFSTLEAICKYLQCQPAEILEYRLETREAAVEDARANQVKKTVAPLGEPALRPS